MRGVGRKSWCQKEEEETLLSPGLKRMSGVMEGGEEWSTCLGLVLEREGGGGGQPEDGRVDCLDSGTHTPSHSLLSGTLSKGWCLSGRPASQIAH